MYSPAEEDFKSQPAIWMDALDRLMDVTGGGTLAIDSEADSYRFFDKFLLRRRHFVVRVETCNSSRFVLFGKDSLARIRDAWEEAKVRSTLQGTGTDARGA